MQTAAFSLTKNSQCESQEAASVKGDSKEMSLPYNYVPSCAGVSPAQKGIYNSFACRVN